MNSDDHDQTILDYTKKKDDLVPRNGEYKIQIEKTK